MSLLAATLMCLVVGISDGDTITVRCGDDPQLKVRLAEIDAPEKRQDFGQRAKQELSELVLGKSIKVEVFDRDRYGRSVARLYVDDKFVNFELVRLGLAWCYRKYLRGPECLELEDHARQSEAGLWHDEQSIAPWDWRKKQSR